MGKATHLHQAHIDAGGKLVDFAGWDMPIHYGSQLEEHHAVRQAAGMFDVSHMTIIDLKGDDVYASLRRLLANDVSKIDRAGKALYTCLLNEEGGIIDDLIVYHLANDHYRIVSNAATRDIVSAWLTLQLRQADVEITLRDDLFILAVQGPKAIEKLQSVLSATQYAVTQQLKPFHTVSVDGLFVSRTGYTGEDGFELMFANEKAQTLWQACLEAGIRPCGLGARDTLRLEAGFNLSGTDMNTDHTPLDSNLGWTVAWKPEGRHFIGREALLAQKEAGHSVLVGLVLEGKGVLRNGLPVWVDGKQGVITSGSFSPTLQRGIAMARIPKTENTNCEIELRGKKLPGKIVKLPFVRNGQCMVPDLTEELTHE